MTHCTEDCPAYGHARQGDEAYCFCYARPTETVTPGAPCMYGIEDYGAYLRDMMIWKPGKNEKQG